MYVLALVTQKGGSGKSTLAVGLAVAAMENGERVALVEADPQGTIWRWKERRGSAYPRVDRVTDPAYLEPVLARLEAEGNLARHHRHRRDQQRARACRRQSQRSLPDPCAAESGRYRSRHTDAARSPQEQPPLCFRSQPDAGARRSLKRGCDVAQLAGPSRAALRRPAQ